MHVTFLLIFIALICCSLSTDYKRVCYFPNWGQYRPGNGAFFPENIDTSLCTHIIYAFARLSSNQLGPIEWNDESTSSMKGLYERFTDLKLLNSSLKTMLSVGGWNAGTHEMSLTLSSGNNRSQFINQSITYLRQRNFDGLDLDFEYPSENEKQNFTLFIQELREAINQESIETGKPALLLSMAIPANKAILEAGYELKVISSSLDFVNLLWYEFHGLWENKTSHESPLYSQDDLNLNSSSSYISSIGIDLSKIVVGMSFYGKCYILADPNNHDIGAPAIDNCTAGPYTQTPGILTHYEICSIYLTDSQTTVYWSEVQQVTYLVNGSTWIGYEDKKSLSKKVEYLRAKGFGGWMAWEVSADDFNGKFCGFNESYPLLKTLSSSISFGSTSTESTSQATVASVTSNLGAAPTVLVDSGIKTTQSTTTTPTTSIKTTIFLSVNSAIKNNLYRIELLYFIGLLIQIFFC